MNVHGWMHGALIAAALTVGLRSGEAKEPAKRVGETEIAQAKTAAKAGDHAKAGTLIGKAVVSAVKLKDLDAEQRAAEALDEILAAHESLATGDAAGDARADRWPGRKEARLVVAATLAVLDPKRHGLFVSAHALALSIVFDAIALGDAVDVDVAAAALAACAATPQAGAGVAAFAKLADALRIARAGDAKKAIPLLADVAASFRAWAWLAPALSAHLELAAQHLAVGDPAKAADVLASARALLTEDADKIVMYEFLHGVEVRAATLPPEALEAFRAATGTFLGASAGMPGGRAGRGASGGGGDVSPLGKALPKVQPGKAFATATRTKAGFDIELPFGSEPPAQAPIERGERAWDAQGVTLLLAGPAVALRMLDVTGLASQPSGRLRSSRAWSTWWLAVGETWNATKDGVEITGRAAAVTSR